MPYLNKLYVDLPRFRAGSLNAYLLAAAIAVLATALRVAIGPWVAGVQFITFFPAVILSTFLCGVRAGMLAMLLCGLAAWYVILPPAWSFALAGSEQLVGLGLYVVVASLDVLIIGAMRAALARYKELSQSLERRVETRTQEMQAQMEKREAVEEQLRQAQKMEAIGQLTGGVAHDFNNLLTAVLGNLDLLAARLENEADRRFVARAIRAAQRGAKLTGQLLAFARKQRLAPRAVNLNHTVTAMQDLLSRTLGGLVHIETDLAGDLWSALVDPTQVEMMLLNLAINARDAMAPQGGTLTITTRNVPAGSRGAPPALAHLDCVLLSVADTGCGMDEAVKAKAFDPFFTTKELGKGSGLGLSQVYGVVTQSGGTVALDSRPGEGTVVRVYLPRAAAAADAEAEPAAVVDAGSGGAARILLVDDDPDVREFTASYLRELGYGVVEAPNGPAALDLLDKDAGFDLLLVDFAMPGMTGAALAREARMRRPGVPVLLLTGYAEPAAIEGGAGELLVLEKPFKPADLATQVAALLASGRDA